MRAIMQIPPIELPILLLGCSLIRAYSAKRIMHL